MVSPPDLADAARFWERGRVIYNMAMFLVVYAAMTERMAAAPVHRIHEVLGQWPALVLWAAIANVLYSAAYALEIAAQLTPFRQFWRDARWFALASGTLLAMLLASLAMMEIANGHF